MSYFAPYLDATGIHIPTYDDRMEYLLTGYRQIFGNDVYLGEDSQDYQLMSLYAKALDDCSALLLDVYNARNPNWATDTALDSLLLFAGIRRNAATKSSAVLTLTGQPGATLPAGMLVRDTNDHSWTTKSAVEFDEEGCATVDAECTSAGSILASAGTITIIETPTLTWYTVTNESDASPGKDVETDAAVRVRRARSVALPGRGTLEGIRSALVNLDNVQHVSVLENMTDETDSNGLPPHSICALVSGGNDAAIAKTVFDKKAPGITTYGNTSNAYQDMYGRTNTVYFSRPIETMATINIRVRPMFGWDGDYMVSAIRQCIIDYLDSVGIGEALVVSALWGEAFKANSTSTPAFSVLSITASGGTYEDTSDNLPANYDTKYITDAGHVLITVVEV